MTQQRQSNISEGITDAIGTGLRKLGRKIGSSEVVAKSKAAFSNQTATEIAAKGKYVDRFLSNIDSALTSYIKAVGGIKALLKQRKLIAEMSFEQFDSLLENEIKRSSKVVYEAQSGVDIGPLATYLTKLMVNNVLKGVNSKSYVQPIKVIAQKLEDQVFDAAMKQIQANPNANPKVNLNQVHKLLTQLANLAWAAASAVDSDKDKDGVDDDHKPEPAKQPEKKDADKPSSQPTTSEIITNRFKTAEDTPALEQVIKNAIQQYSKLGGDKSKLLQDLQSANNQK